MSWQYSSQLASRQETPKVFMRPFRRGSFICEHNFAHGLRERNKSKIKCTFSPNGIWFLTCLGVFPLLSSSIRFSMATAAPSRTVFLGHKCKATAGFPGKGQNNRELMGLSSTSDMKQLLSRRARGSTRGAAGGGQEGRGKRHKHCYTSRPNWSSWQHFSIYLFLLF